MISTLDRTSRIGARCARSRSTGITLKAMVNGWVTAGASQKEVAFQSALPAGVLLPPWVFALGALMWHSGINSATTL